MLLNLLDAVVMRGQVIRPQSRLEVPDDLAASLIAQGHAVLIEAEPEPVKGPEPPPAPAPVAPRTRGAKR